MRACIFCCAQGRKMTGEHVWSSWISRTLYPTRKRVVILHGRTPGSVITKRTATSIDVQPGIVCQQCNNNWLSELENKYMKPMLEAPIASGAPKLFTDANLAALVAWAFKTAVVIDHMEHPRDPFFLPAERERFASDFTVPPGTQVYLFRYSDAHLPRTGSFTTHYFIARRRPVKGLKLYVLTFIAGQFGFQILTRHAPKRMFTPDILYPEYAFREATVEVWPHPAAQVSWPPRLYLGNDILNTFCYRWSRIFFKAPQRHS
jgi:hypothetical protein